VHFEIYVAVAGFIVGLAVGATGMGGGALMTPILVLLFKVQPLAAVSSDLVASLIMKPFGAAIHIGSHTVRWPLVRWLALGSVPAAFLGVLFLRSLGHGRAVQNAVSIALGVSVLLAVGALVVKTLLDRRRGAAPAVRPERLRVRPLPTLALGAVVGFIVGITSVGSGTLVVIALLFLYPRLRGSQLVGTDLTQAIPMVAAAALAHIFYGDFQLSLTLSIIAGSIPGVLVGSVLSSRAPTPVIRVALCLVLLVSGLKLVNVPTPDVGIALAAGLVVAAAVLVYVARTRPEAWRHDPSEAQPEAVAA
jgi:uncharacterized membrane protein YfcA